jgi:hypothetical protein
MAGIACSRSAVPVTLAFCWSHVRRRFYELAAAGPAPIAGEALERIAGLYAIESDIRRAFGQCGGGIHQPHDLVLPRAPAPDPTPPVPTDRCVRVRSCTPLAAELVTVRPGARTG